MTRGACAFASLPTRLARVPRVVALRSFVSRRGPRLAAPWLAACVALGWGSSVRAAELSLAGPPACSDRDELRFRVERALGSSLEAAPALELSVTIEGVRKGYSGRLVVREATAGSGPSERKLEASDCSGLLDALSVVIVLAIDRVRAEEQATKSVALPTAEPEPVPSAEVTTADEVPRADEGDTSSPLRPSVLAWLAGDVGSLPDPALGVGLGVTLDGQRVRWQASGLFFFEQHVELEGQGAPTPGADLSLALGALSACYAPDGSWQSDGVLGVCARFELGRVFGQGTNVLQEREGGQLWAAPGLNLAGAWQVFSPSLRLAVEAGAVLPLVRSEFRLGALGDIYRPAAVSLRAGLGLGIVLE
jgi:hypothetical protein